MGDTPDVLKPHISHIPLVRRRYEKGTVDPENFKKAAAKKRPINPKGLDTEEDEEEASEPLKKHSAQVKARKAKEEEEAEQERKAKEEEEAEQERKAKEEEEAEQERKAKEEEEAEQERKAKEEEEESKEEEEAEESENGVIIPEGDPVGTETITITGRNYDIKYDIKNRKRRAEIFSGQSTKRLTENEEELLKALGITGKTRNELTPYLADFFNSLPKCHSSSQMLTNSRCEIAYYIMWSVLLKARQATHRQLEKEHSEGVSDIETQQIAASVDALASVKSASSSQNHTEHMQIIAIVSRIEESLKQVRAQVEKLPKKTSGGAYRLFVKSH
jgi:hypothetical protein